MINKEDLSLTKVIQEIQQTDGDLSKINFILGHLKKIDTSIKSDLEGKYITSQEKVFKFPNDSDGYVLYITKMNRDRTNKVDSIFISFTKDKPILNKTCFSLTSAYRTKKEKVIEFTY